MKVYYSLNKYYATRTVNSILFEREWIAFPSMIFVALPSFSLFKYLFWNKITSATFIESIIRAEQAKYIRKNRRHFPLKIVKCEERSNFSMEMSRYFMEKHS